MEFLFLLFLGKPMWMWLLFITLVVALLAFDLGVLHKDGDHEIGVAESLKLSAAALAKLRDPNSPLSKRSVYFNYDQYDVKSEYNSQLQAHAKFIASEPNARVLVQGNTDDRGSREYNLALGQRRADAVKKQLVLMGAPESQIESVSLGKEKPKALGDNEAAWAENRRADMLYNGEY